MEGREYLAAHGVQEAVAAAVAEVLRTRPANPIQGIVDILHSRSGGASGTGASAASSSGGGRGSGGRGSGGTRLPQSHDPRGLLDTFGADVDPTAAMLAAGLGSGVLLRSLNLSGILELNLKKAGLLALPPQIGELSQLTKLDVSLSPLSDLPEAIGKLSQLRILFCLGCRFGSVPIVLGTLPALYMLSFKSNKLTSISPAALAIAFCDSRPFVASTVIGATSTEQLEINLQGFGVKWTDELEAEIARIHNYYPDPWRMLVRGGG
jgi:Leucine-rich repeat (LRR) protein